MARIVNDENNKIISGTNEGDIITNNTYWVTINAGTGNDSITNSGSYTSINASSGNDTIKTGIHSEVTINAGEGNDSISNSSTLSVVNGDDGADTIYSYNNQVTINGGSGNDSIHNGGKWSKIYGGAGNDKVKNTIRNFVTISGGEGKDTILSTGSYCSIDGGDGDDYINAHDFISSPVQNVTVQGGKGNDILLGAPKTIYQYSNGDGNDVITNYGSNDTIQIVGKLSSSMTIDSDVILYVNSGSIKLKNAKYQTINIETIRGSDPPTPTPSSGTITNYSKNVVVMGTYGKDSIENYGSNSEIDAMSGDDYIYNDAANVKIYGDAGNDEIYNFFKSDVTIDGGADNDSILSGGSRVLLIGGVGNDTIKHLNGLKATIRGGKGNDKITGSEGQADLFQYANGDGDDVITNFGSEDTLHITSGIYDGQSTIGSDVIVTVGTGKITLKGAAGKDINIKSVYYPVTLANGKKDTNTTKYSTFNGTSYADNLTNHAIGTKIYAGAGNDSIYNISEYVTINGGKGNDDLHKNSAANYNVFQYANGDGNDTIRGYNSTDTLQITSGTYNKSTIGNDVIVTVGSGKVIIKDAKGKRINIKGKISNGGSSTSGGNSSTAAVKGQNVTNSSTYKKINGTSGNDTIKNNAGGVKIYAGAGNDSISNSVLSRNSINGDYGYVTIDGGAGNDTIYSIDPYVSLNGGAGDDSIYAGSIWYNVTVKGGVGNDTISIPRGLDNVIQYASGDGNDTIQNYSSNTKIQITSGSYSTMSSGNDVVIKVGSGKMTIKDAKSINLNISRIRNFEEHWFMEGDDNFTTYEVSTILKDNKNISGNYSLENELKFTQDSEIIPLTHNRANHSENK